MMNGTFNIGGHKVPVVALLAVVVGLAVLLVLRAKGGGKQIAGAGAPATLGAYGSGPNATQADLSTLQSQLEGELQNAMAALRVPPPTPINPAPTPIVPAPTPIAPEPVAPARIANQGPPSGPVGDLAMIQIHEGDSPQSLTDYWTQHGFPGFTAAEFAASNAAIPFAAGQSWHIYAPGGHP